MQLLSTTNYSLLDVLVEAIQVYAIAKEYVIVKSQSKAKYKFDVVTKVDIITCLLSKIDTISRVNACYKRLI